MRPHRGRPWFGIAAGRSPLDTLLLEGIRVANANEGDTISPLVAARGVEEFVALAPARARSWFLRGFAALPDDLMDEGECPEPFLDDYVAGLLSGAIERDRTESVVSAVEAFPDTVRRLVAAGTEPALIAPILMILVRDAAEEACELAAIAPTSFVLVDYVIEAFERRAAALEGSGDVQAAEQLRRALLRFEEPRAPRGR